MTRMRPSVLVENCHQKIKEIYEHQERKQLDIRCWALADSVIRQNQYRTDP